MTESFRSSEVNTLNISIPINRKAKEGNFEDSEIFGITDDLSIVLNLLGIQGIQIPPGETFNSLRGELIAYIGKNINQHPLYLHRC